MAEHPDIRIVRVYADASGEYRWTAYAHNREAIAESSESYVRVGHCVEAAKALFPAAEFDISVKD